jgi:hypothetical protein
MVDYGNVKHPAADVLQTVKGQISKKSMDPKDVVPDAVSLYYCCYHCKIDWMTLNLLSIQHRMSLYYACQSINTAMP